MQKTEKDVLSTTGVVVRATVEHLKKYGIDIDAEDGSKIDSIIHGIVHKHYGFPGEDRSRAYALLAKHNNQ